GGDGMSGEGMDQRYGFARAGERASAAAAALARAALDVLVPPLSPLSPSLADGPGRIEAALWARLQLLAPPWCERCGLPFPYDAGADAVCGACAARTPRYDRARSALAYGDASRPL